MNSFTLANKIVVFLRSQFYLYFLFDDFITLILTALITINNIKDKLNVLRFLCTGGVLSEHIHYSTDNLRVDLL